MNKEYHYLKLKEFIALLKAHGFGISVDTYLDIKKIIANYGVNTGASSMKNLLCPLIAKTPEEQTLFYEVFDQCYKSNSPIKREEVTQFLKVPQKNLAIVVITVLILITTSVFWLNRKSLLQKVDFQTRKVKNQKKEKVEKKKVDEHKDVPELILVR